MTWRRITVDGKKYVWMLGSNSLLVREDKGEKLGPSGLISIWKLLGISPFEWQRGSYKGSTHPVQPKDVARFIKEKFK
jgi:hypothetical protein